MKKYLFLATLLVSGFLNITKAQGDTTVANPEYLRGQLQMDSIQYAVFAQNLNVYSQQLLNILSDTTKSKEQKVTEGGQIRANRKSYIQQVLTPSQQNALTVYERLSLELSIRKRLHHK